MADVLDVVRTALRRKTKALDDTELIPMIEAAKIDLSRAGVSIVSDQEVTKSENRHQRRHRPKR